MTRHLLITGAVVTAFAAVGGSAHAADADWHVTASGTITAAEAGVPPGTSAPRLARAAIEQSATQLRIGRHGRLRLVADRKAPTAAGDGAVRQLRFVQTVGGLRVLWTHLSTDVAGDEVREISGTSIKLPSSRLLGKRKVSPTAAVRIARGALSGKEDALPAEAVAFAGSPAKPQPARRAYVVQLQPAAQPMSETPKTICIVVDAESGKVLDRWEGRAARSLEDRRARAAGKSDVILQSVDAKGSNAVVTPDYRDFYTVGSPFGAGNVQLLQFGNPGNATLIAGDSAMSISRSHWCMVRGMCGRKLSFNGVYQRYFMTVNTPAGSSRYEAQHERIFISPERMNQQVIAHEIGHHLDITLAPDAFTSVEASETYEGIADMYTYDYIRESTAGIGGEMPISQKLANPAAVAVPNGDRYRGHMAAYCRKPGRDLHLNGTILSNAYFRIVQRLGHHVAGHLLPHMSWRLPAKRTFGSVRTAFSQTAAVFYGQGSSVQQAVEQSFDEVGVFGSTVAPADQNVSCK
ncbi:hypothetical protein OJ998_13525 [Solirubrobacter taibaiensis]|nr:hypothetical protein [Solirubrobacter taibaiensis]